MGVRSLYSILLHRVAHAAVLVLLAAAARAGIVAADLFTAVANGFDLLVGLLAPLDGRVLLGTDIVSAGHRLGGSFLDQGADCPYRFREALVVLHAEDGVGDLVAHPHPHAVEFLHA